jgi:hypothetical protein
MAAMRGQHIVIRKQQGRPKGRNHINGIAVYRGATSTCTSATSRSDSTTATRT